MLRWLLEVDVQGRVYRWSTEPLEVDDDHVYRGGLVAPVVTEGSETISLRLDDVLDWPTLAPILQGCAARLYRWLEGTAIADAVIVLAGEVTRPSWGSDLEGVDLQISSATALVLGSPLPDPLARVGELTWPIAGGLSVDAGVSYPIILGYPGYEGATIYPIVPLALAEWSATPSTTYVVVSEDPDAPIASVTIRNDAVGVEASETTQGATDLLGARVLVASFSADATPWPGGTNDPRALFAGFSPGGGGGVARSAYDVIAYLLRRWGPGTCDWSRMVDVAPVLAAYQVDTWIDQSVPDPWTWIAGVLVPDLPVAIRVSPSGRRYLVPTLARLSEALVVAELEVGRHLEAVGRVTLGDGPTNEITAEYREDRAGVYRARVVITGGPGTDLGRLPTASPGSTSSQAVTVVRSGRCVASRASYGPRPARDVQTIDWTWDEGTVLRILEERVEREAIPPLVATYEVAGRVRWNLRENDVIRLTDPDRGILSALAVISSPPRVAAEQTTITVRIPR